MAPEKEKITKMILYVDLKCPCCYKKVRKLLCKFPQIRDQVFDEDNNKVIITVVCCDPERFRDKLCCKGAPAIQCIEIVENKPPPPKQPAPAPAPAPAPKPVVVVDKPKDPPAPKPKPPVVVEVPKDPPPKQLEKKPSGKPKQPPPPVVPVVEMPKPDPPKPKPKPVKMPDPMPMPMDGYHPHQPFCPPVSTCCQECYEGRDGGPCHHGYGRPVPLPVYPPKSADPPRPTCCQECYEGRDGGPCHYGGYGRPVPPPPCYDYYGYQYPPNRPCYSRCDHYFSEDNPQGCSIM